MSAIMRLRHPHDRHGHSCLPSYHPRSHRPSPSLPMPSRCRWPRPVTCWPTWRPSPTHAPSAMVATERISRTSGRSSRHAPGPPRRSCARPIPFPGRSPDDAAHRFAQAKGDVMKTMLAIVLAAAVAGGLAGADDLGIELVELAVAALLGPFVAERGAVGRDLERRILLPALAQVRTANSGGDVEYDHGDRWQEVGTLPQPDILGATVHELGHSLGGRECRHLRPPRHRGAERPPARAGSPGARRSPWESRMTRTACRRWPGTRSRSSPTTTCC